MTGQHAGWLRATPGRYRKALAALWGSLTVPAVVGALALAGVHIDGSTAALIIGIGSAVLGTGAVVAVKPNDPPALDTSRAENINRSP